jgi:NDP-hexose 2,3-enoyl reductase
MAWILSCPHVTAILAGPRTPTQLDAAFRAVEHELSEEELTHLDELFPPVGHGGPAPNAWLT